jgi:hypothetical protein
MRKTGILTFVAVLLVAVTLLGIPALAAGLEYTKTILYFNVGALDEVTVTLVNEGAGTTTSGGAGVFTSSALNFTCSSSDCQWVNASLSGTGTQQSITTPAVTIDNTGTTNAQINISANVTLPAATCFNLRYSNDTMTIPSAGNLNNLNTTNITLVQTYTPTGATLKVWLFGNFSGCTQQVYAAQFDVWALFS